MPSADEQTAGATHFTRLAKGEVRRPAADVEVDDASLLHRPRQFGTAAHERQPRFQTWIVRSGDQSIAEPSTNDGDKRVGVASLCGEPGEERTAAEELVGANAAGLKPMIDHARHSVDIDAVAGERREHYLRAKAFAQAVEVCAARDGVARELGLGNDGGARRRAEIQADQLHGVHVVIIPN